MTTRALTTEDIGNLYRSPPDHVAHGKHNAWSWWLVRHQGYPAPLVEAWISAPYTSHSVWMPGATLATVKAWIETLEMPVSNKVKAA